MIVAMSFTDPAVAVIVTVFAVAGAIVVIVKVALVLPTATATELGTEATVVLLLERLTTKAGSAFPSIVIVPVAVVDPVTVAGLMVRVDNAAGLTVSIALLPAPL